MRTFSYYYLNLLFLVFFSSPSHIQIELPSPQIIGNQQCVKEPRWESLLKKYYATVIAGVVVGASSGYLCRHMDKHVPWAFDWLIWLGIRHALADSLKRNFKQHYIDYDEQVFDNVIFVSAWLSYFTALK